jgi:hypothetical protein
MISKIAAVMAAMAAVVSAFNGSVYVSAAMAGLCVLTILDYIEKLLGKD